MAGGKHIWQVAIMKLVIVGQTNLGITSSKIFAKKQESDT